MMLSNKSHTVYTKWLVGLAELMPPIKDNVLAGQEHTVRAEVKQVLQSMSVFLPAV